MSAPSQSHTLPTYWVRIYLSGPIDVAKQLLRAECLREGLCVTLGPVDYIYTGGEEAGYVVGLVNYPRFPVTPQALWLRACDLAERLREGTHQHSVLIQSAERTEWRTWRDA